MGTGSCWQDIQVNQYNDCMTCDIEDGQLLKPVDSGCFNNTVQSGIIEDIINYNANNGTSLNTFVPGDEYLKIFRAFADYFAIVVQLPETVLLADLLSAIDAFIEVLTQYNTSIKLIKKVPLKCAV